MASTIQADSLPAASADATATDRYRYERKFHVTELDLAEIEMVVRRNPAAFAEIYHPRWINNIYLDTWCRTSYAENLDGRDRNRVKSRIRWYGDLEGMIQHPVLEFKVRQGLVNRKLQYPLSPLEFQGGIRPRDLRELFRRANMPKPLEQDLLKLEPSLINRYRRKYFLSADGIYRLTVDSQQEFRRFGALGRCSLGRCSSPRDLIVELKYATENDPYVSFITQQFPFRLTRNSKYVMGIELTGLR